jgi:hypothetical protein
MAGIKQVAEEISLALPVPPASLIGVDCLDPIDGVRHDLGRGLDLGHRPRLVVHLRDVAVLEVDPADLGEQGAGGREHDRGRALRGRLLPVLRVDDRPAELVDQTLGTPRLVPRRRVCPELR